MHCDFNAQMLEPEMHDSENGTHSANGAETLVLTANNLVYPEPSSTYYDVININHHHHHHHHHHNSYHQEHHQHNYHHNHQYHHTTTTTTTTNHHALHATTNNNDNHHLMDQHHLPATQHSNIVVSDHQYHDTTTPKLLAQQPPPTPTQLTDPQSNSAHQLVEPSNQVEHDEEEEEQDQEEDEEEDDDGGDDGEDDEDEDEDDDEDDEDEVEDEDDGDDESEDDCEDIVDPGQHCQQQAHFIDRNDIIGGDMIKNDDLKTEDDVLDGERMLEVTRKLVRNTERDPDRDLRKQVLLKTAIKKLPHFMDYSRYSDSLDRSFHTNISPQAYYEHHDSQPKFYNSVQPNAIQMSTTGLRMLDLNDDHDPELLSIDQNHSDPNLAYHNNNNNNINISRTPSLEHHDYLSHHHQYDRYQRSHELNHYETTNGPLLRHNSLDNLYQPINGSDINEGVKDITNGDERIPLAFQIACEIYDFTCTPDDNEKKLLDNLADAYYTTKPTKESKTNNSPDEDDCNGDDGTDARDPDGSDTSSHSSISTSDDSANSLVSQLNESDEANGTTLLEASLNSSSEFYHSSHYSGVALFTTSSTNTNIVKKSNNKRSSSSIELDDEMDIDHLTELSSRSSSFGSSNNQYKKLRKREIIE